MDYLLTPDISATFEIDPQECMLRMHLEVSDGDAKAQTILDDYLETTKDQRPRLTIGFFSPQILTALGNRLAGLPKDDAVRMDAYAENHRRICQWGIRGWNLHGEFKTVVEKQAGQDVTLAAPEVVEILERHDWLLPVSNEIGKLNKLSDGQKKS